MRPSPVAFCAAHDSESQGQIAIRAQIAARAAVIIDDEAVNDVFLWELLSTEPPDLHDPRLLELLEELAACDQPTRAPFWGLMSNILGSDVSSELRAAALRVLPGASGYPVRVEVVEHLSSTSAEVVEAAVDVLAQVAVHDSSQWIHGVFHPSLEVRRLVLTRYGDAVDAGMVVFLLVDPGTSHLIARDPSSFSNPKVIPVLLESLRAGALQPGFVIQALNGIRWGDHWPMILSGLSFGRSPKSDQSEQPPPPGLPGDLFESWDFLDDAFALLWHQLAGVDVDNISRERDPFIQLVKAVLIKGIHPNPTERVRRSVLRTGCHKKTWPATALAFAAMSDRDLLKTPSIPLDRRKAAAAALRFFPRLVGYDDPLRELLELDVCRTPDGFLDLPVVAGLLNLAEGSRYQLLERRGLWPAIHDSVRHDWRGGLHLLQVESWGEAWNKRQAKLFRTTLEAVEVEGGAAWSRFLVGLPTEAFDLFGTVGEERLLELIPSLVSADAEPGGPPPLQDTKYRRLTSAISGVLLPDRVCDVLSAMAVPRGGSSGGLAIAVLTRVSRDVGHERFVEAAMRLSAEQLDCLLELEARCPGFNYETEVALIRAVSSRDRRRHGGWLEKVRTPVPPKQRWRPTLANLTKSEALSARAIAELQRLPDGQFVVSLREFYERPITGLCEALKRRSPSPTADLEICAALLVCRDELGPVDVEFTRFFHDEAEWLSKLDHLMVERCSRFEQMSLVGHAWLWRWDRHLAAFEDTLNTSRYGLEQTLRSTLSMRSPLLRHEIWRATLAMLARWRWREPKKVTKLPKSVGELLFDVIVSDAPNLLPEWFESLLPDGRISAADSASLAEVRHLAARMLCVVAAADGPPRWLEDLQERMMVVLTDLSGDLVKALRGFVDTRGVSGRTTAGREETREKPSKLSLSRSKDLALLERVCRSHDEGLAGIAVRRLVELGDRGCSVILRVVTGAPKPPHVRLLAESVLHWSESPVLEEAVQAALSEQTDPEVRFALAVPLKVRGRDTWDAIVSSVLAPCHGDGWFRSSDWDRLTGNWTSHRKLALEIVESPHHAAYSRAVGTLLKDRSKEAIHGLDRFLRSGHDRRRHFRVAAAVELTSEPRWTGAPVLISALILDDEETETVRRALRRGAPPVVLEAAIRAFLWSGAKQAENAIPQFINRGKFDAKRRERLCLEILNGASRVEIQEAALSTLRKPTGVRLRSTRAVARAFAWGMRRAQEMTGRSYRVRVLRGTGLGMTRVGSSELFVSPLPILRGAPDGDEVVRALIMHELGHQIYHAGPEHEEVNRIAVSEDLAGLLNLVEDEHLERNLRSRDEEVGNMLKTLAAHAFQHSEGDVPVDSLLDTLGFRAFPVLVSSRLRAAREQNNVRIAGGGVMLEMERAGSSFARFVRALRMGLGDRHDDPRVDEGLSLFRGKAFREATAQELLHRARRLREIFGNETRALEAIRRQLMMEADPLEVMAAGQGMTDEQIEAEIQDLLKTREGKSRDRDPEPGDANPIRALNLSSDERFDTISNVVPAPGLGNYAKYAARVRRWSRNLRAWMLRLGVSLEPQRFRTSGQRIDRARLASAILRGDPRILVSRRLRLRTDLFLGVLIDCSGSMHMHDNMERAKHFGILIAEAVKGLDSVDARFFGFTDDTIYDAGSADACRVHGLQSGGGNNDAAALWHAARVAAHSRRSARLLVMISDGSPTECSVDALRALVVKIHKRMGINSAQVAVRPISEVCFPYYVEVVDDDFDVSVRRFGAIIQKLVGSTMLGA